MSGASAYVVLGAMGDIGSAVVGAALWCSRDEAARVTGQEIGVDGGLARVRIR